MKNLDLVSKKIAVIAISLCGVLLCASLLIFSVSSIGAANAEPAPQLKVASQSFSYQLFPLGISNGFAYYIFDGGGSWTFEKIPLTKALDEKWVK